MFKQVRWFCPETELNQVNAEIGQEINGINRAAFSHSSEMCI